MRVRAHSDGGSRGNPGKAACAAIVYDTHGNELLRRARLLGVATNNVAEYAGVELALVVCRDLGACDVHLRIDSELVVRQIEGRYRVRNRDLKPFYARVMALLRAFDTYRIEHVPREQNAAADALVNAALDGKDID